MTSDNLNEQVKESFSEALFYERSVETALKYMTNTNPVERVLKAMDTQDESIKKDMQERVKMMNQTWLQTFDDFLTAGKSLPVDIIGKASDMAKASRKRVVQD
jgi:ABC-type transporter MlaC component